MKFSTSINQIIKNANILFIILAMSQITITAQSFFEVETFEKPYLYTSAHFYKNKDFSKVSLDQIYRNGVSYANTGKLDLGFQFTKSLGLELSYVNQSLWMTSAVFEEELVRSSSRSNINYFSLSLVNSYDIKWSKLKPNKWKLKTQLGYTLGRTKQGTILGSSTGTGQHSIEPGPLTDFNTQTITYGLSTGNHHFLNIGAGLEYRLSNRISLTAGYYHIQGFKDIIRQRVEYNTSNNQTGSVDITSDASIGGLTLGAKYSFR